jgi:hypothetical protein
MPISFKKLSIHGTLQEVHNAENSLKSFNHTYSALCAKSPLKYNENGCSIEQAGSNEPGKLVHPRRLLPQAGILFLVLTVH